ncbi:MAG TPA: hypothetical protein GXX28_03510 [Firmicutes bacterium]|nr:hypothetical protein [Bacillota bacterium]
MNLRQLVEFLRRQDAGVEVAGDLGALDREVLAVTTRPTEAGPRVALVVEPACDPSAVQEALERGVAAVIVERPPDQVSAQFTAQILAQAAPQAFPVVRVTNSRDAFRGLLEIFYGVAPPRLPLWCVTGPGRTALAFLLHRCLTVWGLPAGLWADPLDSTSGRGAPEVRGTGFPAGLALFLRDLAERGGQTAILSLRPEDLAGLDLTGPTLKGLILAGRLPPAAPPLAIAPEALLLPAGRHLPSEMASVFTFGPGLQADLRYRRLPGPSGAEHHRGQATRRWLAAWSQEIEFTAGPRLLRGRPDADVTPAVWRIRLATPGPAARRAAAAATAAALLCGVPPAMVGEALRSFPGVFRHCQLVHAGSFAVVDDLAHTPREAAAALAALAEAESLAGQTTGSPRYRRLHPVCAVAGGLGAVHNLALGRALARLLPGRRAERLIVTESLHDAPPEARVAPEERVSFVAGCRGAGFPLEYYPELEDALSAALRAVREGDLVLLLGGPGMNRGQALLEQLIAARGLSASEPFDEWGAQPWLRPLSLAELTRRENLPGCRPGFRNLLPIPPV